jgi:dTDP-4-dehydrorhamnose reductase
LKVLVTGVNGQLGYDVVKCLEYRNISCIGVDIEDFDITDADKTFKYIKDCHPDVVVHCSAYTAVDKAEDDEELCKRVNVLGTRNIALVCREIGAKMMYISTDYVFSGDGEKFYEVNDEENPISVYGRTKLDGELVVKDLLEKYFIVRISWVFGKNGNNFVKTMLRLGKEKDEINVVGDQFGSPTYTADVAQLICEMIGTMKFGTYHATNEGVCSWCEFAQEIMKLAGYHTKVNFISTNEYPTKAIRPKNSRLSKDKLEKNGFQRLPNWKDALKRYLEELGNLNND